MIKAALEKWGLVCLDIAFHRCRPSVGLTSHQPRPLSELTLEDEHLLSESQDLAVSVIHCQTTNQGGEGRQQQEDDVPDHDLGIVPQLNDVKGQKALSSEAHKVARLALRLNGLLLLTTPAVSSPPPPSPARAGRSAAPASSR